MKDAIEIAKDIIRKNSNEKVSLRTTDLFDKLRQVGVSWAVAHEICDSMEGVEGLRREWHFGQCYTFLE